MQVGTDGFITDVTLHYVMKPYMSVNYLKVNTCMLPTLLMQNVFSVIEMYTRYSSFFPVPHAELSWGSTAVQSCRAPGRRTNNRSHIWLQEICFSSEIKSCKEINGAHAMKCKDGGRLCWEDYKVAPFMWHWPQMPVGGILSQGKSRAQASGGGLILQYRKVK